MLKDNKKFVSAKVVAEQKSEKVTEHLIKVTTKSIHLAHTYLRL